MSVAVGGLPGKAAGSVRVEEHGRQPPSCGRAPVLMLSGNPLKPLLGGSLKHAADRFLAFGSRRNRLYRQHLCWPRTTSARELTSRAGPEDCFLVYARATRADVMASTETMTRQTNELSGLKRLSAARMASHTHVVH
jgi:hypothetical protein